MGEKMMRNYDNDGGSKERHYIMIFTVKLGSIMRIMKYQKIIAGVT